LEALRHGKLPSRFPYTSLFVGVRLKRQPASVIKTLVERALDLPKNTLRWACPFGADGLHLVVLEAEASLIEDRLRSLMHCKVISRSPFDRAILQLNSSAPEQELREAVPAV
jgi:hypothetical protein